jgi:general secretion pathway protein D/MSHA biogenesis protein MshL
MNLKNCAVALCLALMLSLVTSCGTKKKSQEQPGEKTVTSSVNQTVAAQPPPPPMQLPPRFQSPGYIPAAEKEDNLIGGTDEYKIKVGATIRSSGGPQPLWDVMKRLANLKGMTVSWSSDVDQNFLVDVDISANEDFFEAVTNLLRQADYFHEVKGKTIVVRNKETKVYQIGIPAMQLGYTSNVGGNFLSNKDAADGTEGSVKITSPDNKIHLWENIEANLRVILRASGSGIKSTAASQNQTSEPGAPQAANNGNRKDAKPVDAKGKEESPGASSVAEQTSRQSTEDDSSFIIDKSIGQITVTAKPVQLKTVDNYINNLKKHLTRQVNIEAKIIEVYLQENSKIGLDWSNILKDFSMTGTASFGTGGQVYPHTNPNEDLFANTFLSRVVIEPMTFNLLFNALNEQGDTHVLANPKLTVLNGQPALISVGKDVAYIKTVTRDVDSDTNETTYSAEVDNVVAGIALGVMATIVDDKKVILHLTPVTTDIENLDSSGNIPLTSIGGGAIELSLPVVKVREMSTMVEVLNGEMLIIGGLIDSIEGNNGSFAPGLGSIPGIKYLFGVEEKIKQKRELVILLTPRII